MAKTPAKKTKPPMKAFEKSKYDVEKKGAPEGGMKDMAADKKQMPNFLKGMKKGKK
jgi:hypothetical protein